jgi:hypothetical protein
MFTLKNLNLNLEKMPMKEEIKSQRIQMYLIEQVDYLLVKMKVEIKVLEFIKPMTQKQINKKVFDL